MRVWVFEQCSKSSFILKSATQNILFNHYLFLSPSLPTSTYVHSSSTTTLTLSFHLSIPSYSHFWLTFSLSLSFPLTLIYITDSFHHLSLSLPLSLPPTHSSSFTSKLQIRLTTLRISLSLIISTLPLERKCFFISGYLRRERERREKWRRERKGRWENEIKRNFVRMRVRERERECVCEFECERASLDGVCMCSYPISSPFLNIRMSNWGRVGGHTEGVNWGSGERDMS